MLQAGFKPAENLKSDFVEGTCVVVTTSARRLKNSYGDSLLEGVQNNDEATVDRLLQCDNVGRKNFDVNGCLYDSLLLIAVHNNSYEICNMLLRFGADVNMFDIDDQTPLNVAERNMNYSVCKLLVKKRKRKERKIWYNKALHICARKDDLVLCKKHINSIDVNETDEKERTPLHVAVIFASDELCELLLKYGADVNAKDSYNDSPIQLAFYHDRHALREKLLHLTYFG